MMHLVTGGSGSGKSAYAEQQVLAAGNAPRYYIATMMPYGEEGRRRVEKHRRMRKEKHFETIECYTNLAQVRVPKGSTVLLECLSNLTANELYDPAGAKEETVKAVMDGILSLRAQAGTFILVSNEIFSDGVPYDASMLQYISYLGQINQEVAALADRVTEVVYGIPVPVRPERCIPQPSTSGNEDREGREPGKGVPERAGKGETV